jgi:1,4-dihydroxy-2-naphthoyl-CoA hydrolase
MNSDIAASMPLAKLLGITITRADNELVEGTLQVKEELCTLGGTLHGGAIMTLADSLGAVAAFLNLPEGATGTTTIESKTNFLRAAATGTTVTGRTKAVNVGRRLSVWTTSISGDVGKPIAVVTQTQLVI